MLRIGPLLLFYLILLLSSGCEPKNEEDEKILIAPSIDLNSVYFNASQVEVAGEVRRTSGETATLLISESPFPQAPGVGVRKYTLPDKEKFSITISDLQKGVKYYLVGVLEQGDKSIESNQLEYIYNDKVNWQRHTDMPESEGYHEFTTLAHSSFIYFYQPLNIVESRFLRYSFYDGNWQVEKPFSDFDVPRHAPFLFYDHEDFIRGGGYVLEEDYGNNYRFLNDMWGNSSKKMSFIGNPGPRLNIKLDSGLCVLEKQNPQNFWEYKVPLWTKKASFPGPLSYDYKASYDSGRIFIITENRDSSISQEMYFYDYPENQWLPLPHFPGEKRINGVAFSLKGKFYYGTGISTQSELPLKDLWEFDYRNNTWNLVYYYPGKGNSGLSTVRLDDRIFLGLGFKTKLNNNDAISYFKAYDLWQFIPNE